MMDSDFFIFWVTVVFVLGACLGSFANVVIYRLPKKESLMGRSRCQSCKANVPFWANIPMLGYFLVKGKCVKCGEKFSIRYPLVEFLTAVLFAVVFYHYGWSWTTLEYLILTWMLVVCSFIDLDHMILPDVFTLSGIVIGLVGALLNPERTLIEAILGLLFGGGMFWAIAYVYYLLTGREGLGGGDIKLMGWLGVILGWRSIPFIVFASSITGLIAGLIVARKSENRLKAVIPFGPFIALAALLYIIGLKSAGLWYVDLFFPSLD